MFGSISDLPHSPEYTRLEALVQGIALEEGTYTIELQTLPDANAMPPPTSKWDASVVARMLVASLGLCEPSSFLDQVHSIVDGDRGNPWWYGGGSRVYLCVCDEYYGAGRTGQGVGETFPLYCASCCIHSGRPILLVH